MNRKISVEDGDPEAKSSAAETGDPAKSDAGEAQSPQGGEEAELKQMQADLEQARDLMLRTRADFENFRKRAAREKEDAIKYANSTLIERLIPISDNFELGLSAARADAQGSAILAGLGMVAKQLQEFLIEHGVQPIDAAGQKFDPNLHEAIAQEEDARVEEGHVIRQVRKGYKLKDRLLRPANVIVSKGPPAA